jgi:SAM-dependent methyltransferase
MYLAGRNPREQSGFGRDAADWERFRRPVAAAIDRDGTFLDVGCANGLLMESVAAWTREDGHRVEPYGLELSERLAALARERLPRWRERIFPGNALFWEPPMRFDFVRTELVYVPPSRRRELAGRLLERVVAPGGRLIVCSYGSSRPDGARAEPLLDEIESWGMSLGSLHEVVSPEHGFVITRVAAVRAPSAGDGRGRTTRLRPRDTRGPSATSRGPIR